MRTGLGSEMCNIVAACRGTQGRDMLLLGAAAVYLASVLLGFTNAATVQPVIDHERTVFYR